MARILIGWEFGANRGHVARMLAIAARLRAHGHATAFAVQRVDSLAPTETAGGELWQAPVSPRLLTTVAKPRSSVPRSMGDILARLGMDDEGIVAAMIRAWRQLFSAARPDLVIADFAPYMLLAARGRISAIGVGNAFTLPPAEMERFPSLVGGADGDDTRLFVQVNAALVATDTPPLTALPQVFGCDRSIPEAFAEFDPYAKWRKGNVASPLPAGFDAVADAGEEVFVYTPETISSESMLWAGLADSGLKIRVYSPRASAELREIQRQFGFAIESAPVPFARIAERSRLLASHGSSGFISSGLAAGLPHVVFHYDLEKLWNGLALTRLRLGGHVSLRSIQRKPFADSLRAVHADEALSTRARDAAPGFRARGQLPLADAVAEAVASLD